MANRLKIQRLDTIGLVDSGANQHSHIKIWKRADMQDTPKTDPGFIKTLIANIGKRLGWADTEVAEMAEAVTKGELANVTKFHGDKMDKLTDEQQAEFDALTERAEKAEARVAELDDTKDGDELAKADLPDEVRAAIEKKLEESATRADEAEARIQKLEDEKTRARFIAKANSLGDLGMTGDDHGELLSKVYAHLEDEDADALDKLFTAAAERSRTAALFQEVGSGELAKGSVEAEVDALVADIQKADSKVDAAVARGQIWKDRPDLYTRYEAERQRAVRAVAQASEE